MPLAQVGLSRIRVRGLGAQDLRDDPEELDGAPLLAVEAVVAVPARPVGEGLAEQAERRARQDGEGEHAGAEAPGPGDAGDRRRR